MIKTNWYIIINIDTIDDKFSKKYKLEDLQDQHFQNFIKNYEKIWEIKINWKEIKIIWNFWNFYIDPKDLKVEIWKIENYELKTYIQVFKSFIDYYKKRNWDYFNLDIYNFWTQFIAWYGTEFYFILF